MKRAILCDLDNTIFSNTERFNKFSKLKGNGDLEAFHSMEEVLKDPPFLMMIRLLEDLSAWNQIIILSARHQMDYEVSKGQLDKHRVPYDRIILAPDGDETPAPQFKTKIYKELLEEGLDVWLALDDCLDNCKALREAGLETLHVRERGY